MGVKMEEEREMKRTRRGREKTLQHRQQQHRQQQHRQQHPRQQKAKSNRALKRLRKTRTKVPTNRNKNNSSRERPTGRASRKQRKGRNKLVFFSFLRLGATVCLSFSLSSEVVVFTPVPRRKFTISH